MTALDQLCITKACEFLLEPMDHRTFIERYLRMKDQGFNHSINPYFVRDRNQYTAREMVLLINELANKFREMYNAGVNQEYTINLNVDTKKN